MEGTKLKKYAAASVVYPDRATGWLAALQSTQGREWLAYYGVPWLARKVRDAAGEPAPLPPGERLLLYKHPLPGEAQARLAYEYVLSEFVRFLEQKDKSVLDGESSGHVMLWFPTQVPPATETWLVERWKDFLDKLTGYEGFRRTFALAINSAKLAGGAGFSTLETPIFSTAHALSLAGFYWLGIEHGLEVNQRDLAEARRLEEDAPTGKDPQKILEKASEKRKKAADFQKQAIKLLEKTIKKNSNSRAAETLREVLKDCAGDLQNVLAALKTRDPDRYDSVKRAAAIYGSTARFQLNTARGDIFSKVLWELVRLAEGEYEINPVPPLLSVRPFVSGVRSAGDSHGLFCYSCGRALSREATKFKSRRLLFENPEQRAQSAWSSSPVDICSICAGLSLLSPVKLSSESLVIRLGGRGNATEEARRALERQVMNELGTSAGPFFNLRAIESDANGNPAPQVWGRKQYAYAKLALTFPPEVFHPDLEVVLYDKGTEVSLNSVALYVTAGFARAYQQEIRRENDLNRYLGRAVRYFDRGQVIYGEYELLRGFVEGGFDARELGKLQRQAEETRGGMEGIMNEKGAKQEIRKYKEIVGYSSLLYAFTEQARRALRDADLKPEDKDRELRKLLQLADSDPPVPFLNRVAAAGRTSGEGYGYDEVRLYWDERHQYGYLWARKLLEEVDQEAGISVQREQEGEWEGRPRRYLSLRPEDIIAVSQMLRTRNTSPADWKAFLYHAKLFLFTRYPRLLQG